LQGHKYPRFLYVAQEKVGPQNMLSWYNMFQKPALLVCNGYETLSSLCRRNGRKLVDTFKFRAPDWSGWPFNIFALQLDYILEWHLAEVTHHGKCCALGMGESPPLAGVIFQICVLMCSWLAGLSGKV
jgi:hypothetical protein